MWMHARGSSHVAIEQQWLTIHLSFIAVLAVLGHLHKHARLFKDAVQHLPQVFFECARLLLGHEDVVGHAQQQPLKLNIVELQRLGVERKVVRVRLCLWGTDNTQACARCW